MNRSYVFDIGHTTAQMIQAAAKAQATNSGSTPARTNKTGIPAKVNNAPRIKRHIFTVGLSPPNRQGDN